ncbi:MAG: hypothetical protein ACK47B_18840 [Armatimonadota bacterium]
MFEADITEEAVTYARSVLARHNFGRRGVADGTVDQQLTGLVGEIVVQDLFDYPRARGQTSPDGGVDLVFHGITIDVKTMRRDAPVRRHYVNNFSGLQADTSARAFIFCSLNWSRRVLTVCGWTLKDLFFRIADFHPRGALRPRADGTSFPAEADLYEIKNQDLYNPRTIRELHDDLLVISIAEGRCSCQSCGRDSGRAPRETALDLPILSH